MTEQPRDEKGRFVQMDNRQLENENDDLTIAEIPKSGLTPSIDWVNVSVEYLKEAIDRTEEYDGLVRIGTVNKKEELDGGKEQENGLVCLKPSPSRDNCVVVAGKVRDYDKGSDYDD